MKNLVYRTIRLELVMFVSTGLILLLTINVASAQPLDVPQDQYVEINGARLHYLDWGGTGPTMLMVHGLWQTAHWYNGLAPHFTDRYRVIGLTRREHGASQKDTGPFTWDSLADDISDFLRIVTAEPATVVGHSYGGFEIARLAQQHPEQITAIVLLDAVYNFRMWISEQPPFPSRWGFPEEFASYKEMDRWFQAVYAQVWSDAFATALRSQTYLAGDGSVQWQFPWASPKGSEFISLYSGWSDQAFPGIEVPILSIQADFGGFFEREFERWPDSGDERDVALTWSAFDASTKLRGRTQLERAAPHAEHEMLLDTHHWVFLQRPTDVIRRMDEFLDGR